jgi:hypothetical protein
MDLSRSRGNYKYVSVPGPALREAMRALTKLALAFSFSLWVTSVFTQDAQRGCALPK